MKLTVIFSPGESGWIVAECTELPGCISQGLTRDEALENIREAIDMSLAVRKEQGMFPYAPGYEVLELEVAV